MSANGHAFLHRPRFAIGLSVMTSVLTKLLRGGRVGTSRKQCTKTELARIGRVLCLWVRLLFLFLLGAPTSFAQARSLEVSQYSHMSWTAREGFLGAGSSVLFSIAQTTDGYLWLASGRLLLRFDGVRFYDWKPPANESLPAKPATLLGSRDGSLWIGGAGLAQLKANGELRRYHQLDGTEIEGLIEDRDGGIWAGGGGQPQSPKLCRFYHGESECFPADSFLGEWAGALYEDGKGQVLACASSGIWRLRPGPVRRLAPLAATVPCRALGEDSSGTLVFTRVADVKSDPKMVTADGRIQLYSVPVAQSFSLLKDREGDLWIGTQGQGIVHIRDGRTDRFSASDGLSSNIVFHIFQDREGNLWAVTRGGLDKFTKPAVATMVSKQGLSNDGVNSVLTDHEGRLWVGTRSGLDTFIDGRVVKSAIKVPHGFVTSLFEMSDGRKLVGTGTEQGMVRSDGYKVSRLPVITGGNVFGVAEDNRGDLWVVARDSGLLHLDPDGKLIQAFDRTILGKFGIALAYDPKRDGLWLTSRLGDLGLFKAGKFIEQYGASDGLGQGMLRDPQVDKDGGVWVGTRIGLAHLASERVSVLGTKNGLPCDAVHWMRHDRDHNVWLFMECGLVALSENELSSWIADPSRTVTIIHYLDNTDGVFNTPYNGWYTPQVATTSDGRIVFAAAGLSILDPRNLNQNRLLPPVHIEEITADDQVVGDSGHVSLPTRVRRVHIAFTALSFAEPWKVRFRYRLQGYDKDWSSPVTIREATYTNLPPGHYEFRVIACNNDGLWNTTGDTLSFFIPPAFYQTTWFEALMAITVAAVLWGLYLFRLRQATANVQERLLAQMEERERIARELHDTLLQGFQGITLRVQGVAKNISVQDPLRKMMDDVLDRADGVLREARQRVRNLRRRTTDENDLTDRLTKCGEELSKDQAASFTFAIVGEPKALESMVQDEAYRIAAEALTNAFRHASASRIETEVTYDSSALRIRVRDDGAGIDKAVLADGHPDHFGLTGMRERARAIRAELNIWSREAAGTEVELVIPASIAYPREETKTS